MDFTLRINDCRTCEVYITLFWNHAASCSLLHLEVREMSVKDHVISEVLTRDSPTSSRKPNRLLTGNHTLQFPTALIQVCGAASAIRLKLLNTSEGKCCNCSFIVLYVIATKSNYYECKAYKGSSSAKFIVCIPRGFEYCRYYQRSNRLYMLIALNNYNIRFW